MKFFIGLRNALPVAILLWVIIFWAVVKFTTGCAVIDKECWMVCEQVGKEQICHQDCWRGLLVKDSNEPGTETTEERK